MLLVHPPIAKPSEPPGGIPRLSGALKRHGIPCTTLDANLEGILSLLARPVRASDTWTTRALRHLGAHLDALKRPEIYSHRDAYRRAVQDVNRIIGKSPERSEVRLSLVNYSDGRLSPVRSRDLLRAAEQPEANPFYPCFRDRLLNLIETAAPRIVGLSVNYQSQALCAFSMMGFLRRKCPKLKLVLGGGLISSWMQRPGWKSPFGGLVDEMIAGPGERALVSMAGVAYEEGADLPDYTPFRGLPYFAPGFILPYSASAGCYWRRCSFCPEKAEGNRYLPVHPRRAAHEVRTLVEKTAPVLVHFLDNAMSPSLLEELALSGPGIPWYGFARITPHLEDPDLCRALRKSGCVMLKLGIESGDQDVLDRLQKGIDIRLASRVLKALSKAGIGTYVYLLFGTPPETLEKARKTLDFVVAHRDSIDFLNLAVFNMPFHGPDAEDYGTSPFYDGDLSLYTRFEHPSGWDRPRVREFLDREFTRHPAVAAILRRDPPLFTSNHAPFFVNRGKGI
jgi:hypothetical protein